MTLEGASSVVTGGVASLITLGQTINTNGYTLSVGGGVGQASFTSAISGAGGLSVDAGNSTVTLSGTNTYGGGTAVTAGTLIVSSAASVLSGSNLFVGSGVIAAFNPSFGTIQPAGAARAMPQVPRSECPLRPRRRPLRRLSPPRKVDCRRKPPCYVAAYRQPASTCRGDCPAGRG